MTANDRLKLMIGDLIFQLAEAAATIEALKAKQEEKKPEPAPDSPG